MPSSRPALARIELDRFWVTPGDRIFAMYTFLSSGPMKHSHEVSVKLKPVDGGDEIDCSFNPCLPTTEWPEDKCVREGYFPLYVPDDAVPGKYDVLAAIDGPYCRACDIDIMPPKYVTRREPITHDLIDWNRDFRSKPADPVVLQNDDLQVMLNPASGLPVLFRTSDGTEITGDTRGSSVVAAVHRPEPRACIAEKLSVTGVTVHADRAAFRFDADFLADRAVSFSLVYSLEGSTVSITLEDIREEKGFELILVELPALAAIDSRESNAWIAYAEDSGQLVELKNASPGRLRATTEWRFSAPVAILGKTDILAALEVPAYLDTTELTVREESSYKAAWLGTTKVLKIPGGTCTPNLPAKQPSLCRIHILSSSDGSGSVTWLDAVKKIRSSMPGIPTRYYDNRNIYKIFCQCAGGRPVTTFQQAGDIIRSFAALTDYHPQSVYLVGWQYTGHDSGYPAVDVVNQEIGGETGLQELMETASEVDCTVSFHDNYDDAYRDSPDWNEDYIARNPDGSLMMGGWWAGGQSWIHGMDNYAGKAGWDRAVYTCRKYNIRDTYHIDVLSAEALRHDWNPRNPASAYDNLMGKYRIVDAFASCGVDVTTEGVSWPFIGKVTWFYTLQQARGGRFGGETQIPLVQALYRHSARWGGSVGSGEGALRSLYGGCSFGLELTSDPAALQNAVDAFYIVQVPWFQLRDRPLESWKRKGEIETLGYGPGTSVTLDWENTRYSVKVDGVEIARDHSTFCRLGENKLVFYSIEPKELTAPLPEGWNPGKLHVRALYASRPPEDYLFKCDGSTIKVNTPSRRPVIVSCCR